jgi:hypothetical protein
MVERDHQDRLGLLFQGDDLVRLGERGGQRLLHQDVLAGPQRGQADLGVQVVRGRDDHQVKLWIGQQLGVVVGRLLDPVRLRQLGRRADRHAGHGSQPYSGVTRGRGRVTAPHDARPDDADTDRSRVSVQDHLPGRRDCRRLCGNRLHRGYGSAMIKVKHVEEDG